MEYIKNKDKKIQFLAIQVVNICIALLLFMPLIGNIIAVILAILLPFGSILYIYLIYRTVRYKQNRIYNIAFLFIGVLCYITSLYLVSKYFGLDEQDLPRFGILKMSAISMFAGALVACLVSLESLLFMRVNKE